MTDAFADLLAVARRTEPGSAGDAMQYALSNMPKIPEHRRAAAAEVRRLSTGRRPIVMHLFAVYEPEYLIEVAGTYARDDDDGRSWAFLAADLALHHREHTLGLLRALRGLRANKQDVIRQVIAELTCRDDHRRKAVERAQLTYSDAPPPTFAQCRDALDISGWPPADLSATVRFGVTMDSVEAAMRAFAEETSGSFQLTYENNDIPPDVNSPAHYERSCEVKSEQPRFVALAWHGAEQIIRLQMDGPIDDVERTLRALRRHLGA